MNTPEKPVIACDDTGIGLHLAQQYLRINVITENIIHIICSKNQECAQVQLIPSISVILNQTECVTKELWHLESNDSMITIATSQIQLQIALPEGKITFRSSTGDILLSEMGAESRKITDTVVMGEKTYEIQQFFTFKPGEALYGLGQHQDTDLKINYRNQEVDLYQSNMKIAVPVLVSTEGYGILWDNTSLSKFKDSPSESYFWSEVADAINYYFIKGPELDEITKGIHLLTGKCPMMPKYAFGYVQCKQRYKTAEEVVNIVKEYRTRKIPLDLIVQDWRYWGSLLMWGQKSFIKRRYPNPKQMCDDVHSLNAKIMISIWPNMSMFTRDNKEMKKQGFLFKKAFIAIYDAFNPQARELYWKQTREGLFKYGIDAWWCDSTEPAEYFWIKGEPTKENLKQSQVTVLKNAMKPSIGTAARYLNAYSMAQSQNIYEHQRAESTKRVLNLTRSGFTGQQRYSTFVWSGDISSRWDVFAAQVPACINYCMTGNPYWTVDIGGFFYNKSKLTFNWKGDYAKGIKDLGFCELYIRWFEFGAFLPMFRSHGNAIGKEVWRFGEAGSLFYDTLVKYIDLRYRLLPYIYSIAWKITNEDYSMLRSLVFDFRKDSNVYEINDEYMFGPSILVCPVLQPMYYEVNSQVLNGIPKSRKVYLPSKCDWIDFWTGKRYTGGQTIEVEAPMETIPLYIKAGSIIPMGPKKQFSTENEDPIELRIYTGADGSFTLYEDENDTYNYEQGHFSLISFTWKDSSRILTIGKRNGSYKGMLESRTFNIVLVDERNGFGIEPQGKVEKKLNYTGNEIQINLK